MSSSSRLAILASLLVGAVPEVAAAQEVVAETPFREVGTFEAEVRCFSIDAAGETAYVVDTGGQAYAWDLSGDEERWRARIGSGFSANAIDVGEEYVAYVIGIPGASILDAATGADGPRVGIADPRLSSFAVACDPKDRWVWVGTRQGVMVRLNPKDVNGWSTRPMHNEGITSVAMDARGKLIAVGGEDATIRFVNAKSASRDDKKILEGHAGPVTALAFDPKGSLLVSGSDDGSLRVWRASSGKQRLEVGGHDARLGGLAVDPKGRWIAAGYGDGVLKILDLKKGEELATLMREDSGPISGLEFVGKSATLAVANGFDVLTFWDLSGL